MNLARFDDAATELSALAAAGAPETLLMAIERQLNAAKEAAART